MTQTLQDDTADIRRREIIAAALELLDEVGFDRLSLRRLALPLGMHAPGLYWYVESKQALIDLMAKEILQEGLDDIGGLAEGQTWDDWLIEMACATRRALLVRRDGARVVASAFLLRTTAITPLIERSLGILDAAGFEQLVALGGTMTLIRCAIGSVLDEQASPILDASAREHLRARNPPVIDAVQFPRAASAMRQVFDGKLRGREAMFRWGATLIVRGMERMITKDG